MHRRTASCNAKAFAAEKRVFVEPAGGGTAKWMNGGVAGLSYALTRAMCEVLLGATPPVSLTRRAEACLAARNRRT